VKSAELTPTQIKFTETPATNALLADANYWTVGQSEYSPPFKMAPHTAAGAAMVPSSSSTLSVSTNSASVGAVGGNLELFDGSVNWLTISSMQTYSASSVYDAYANW
jgi:hypothetical protein